MADLNVTFGDMTDAANRLSAGRDDITDRLHGLQTMIHGLIGSGFVTDTASGVFGAAFEQFTSGATQAVSALEGLATFLLQAAQALERTDEQLGAAIGS